MKTEVTHTIQAPASGVWDTISQGGDVHRWFTGVITACELKGAGEGAERHCTMANGAELSERILQVDHDAKRFRYAIDKHPLPATNVIATIDVLELPEGRTQVTWGAEYDTTDEYAEMVDETLNGLYAQGISALEAFNQQAA